MSYLDVKQELVRGIMKRESQKVRTSEVGGFVISDDGPVGISDQYIVLDTLKKNMNSNPSKGIFSFDLSYRVPPSNNHVRSSDSLSDLIEIEIFAFYIEKPKPIPFITTPEQTNTHPKLVSTSTPTADALKSYSDVFMLEIKELKPNAVADYDQRWHTFMLTPTITPSDNFFLMPLNGIYQFTDITEHLSTITIQFYSDNNYISFYDDIYYNVLPIKTNIGTDNYITFNIPNHSLDTHDRIHIYGLSTNDNIITMYLLRNEGHLVNIMDTNTIRLDPDVDITNVVNISRCNISVDKRRIRIPLRFRKVMRRITNFKSP